MVLSAIISALAPLVKNEFSLLWNFKKDVDNLSSTLSAIEAVLEDADQRTALENNNQMKDWLQKLKREAYVVRDIVDEWTFEHLRLQVQRQRHASFTLNQVTNRIRKTWKSFKIGHKIKEVQEKLDKIASERSRFHLRESNPDSRSDIRPQTISILTEKVFGRDMEKQKIVNILVNSSDDANQNVSVLPILGPGGIGKTTLAQLVFNNDKVIRHFHPKIWVCVSEKFDIELILKAIIGTTNETSLELLKNMVQDKVRAKRFLLVLDDVWNENEDEWKKLRTILDCGSNGAFILTTTHKKIVAKIMKTSESFDLSAISQEDCMLVLEERAFIHGIPKTENFLRIGRQIADKCMGVPLVAKTLGGQLAFKNDENEWCRIRDSEIWEISENEKSILPILRLSYYDLPYHLRRCYAFCAIFPKDFEIEKDRLIHLWMAHDLIPTNNNQELEDNGNIIWNELLWRSFFQEERLSSYILTCKMHDLMHDLAQSVMKDECYMVDAKSSSKDFGQEIRHVTIMMEEFKELPLSFLKNKGGLQSIILQYKHNYGSTKFSKENFVVSKEFSSLRVLEKYRYSICPDLSNVQYLKHLRYLNLSYNSALKELPNSIGYLLHLQTLNLNYCGNLESLPINTKNLINLRHLCLENCYRLKYMPKGMGRLRNLKTLNLFVIRKESDGQLDELKELDIRGYLKIKNLENVSDASIAKGISMSNKSGINQLELYWDDYLYDNEKKTSKHEKIGEALEVSSKCLKRLTMRGYKGVNMPKWVGESSASLVELRLQFMDNVQHIFTINNMINTTTSKNQLFPSLEKLVICRMWNLKKLIAGDSNLKKLIAPDCITDIGAFSSLSNLEISYCPNLGALPAEHLKSLNHVTVLGEYSDELLHSILELSALTHLCFLSLEERTVLFPAANINKASTSDDVPSTFQSHLHLTIHNCRKLRCLFDEESEELAAGGGQTKRTSGLNSLDIRNCPELMISVEQWRHLITPSLQDLSIRGYCPKLVPSEKEEEADEVITLLRSLRSKLDIGRFYVDFLPTNSKEEEERKRKHSGHTSV